MNAFERLKLALKVLADGKTAYSILPSWEDNKPTYPAANFYVNVKDGYRKNELIFACINYKADSTAMLRLVGKIAGSGKEIPENHPLNKLIRYPNPFMTEFDFYSTIMIYLDLAGRCYFEKVRSRSGAVVQLWPLRPDWMAPIRSSESYIAGYEYKVPGLEQPIRLETKDVLDFVLHDPLNRYDGLAPVSVAGRVGDVDNSATDFIKVFFEHGGLPMGLLKTKQKLIDIQVSDIRRRWREKYGGFQNWTEPAVLDSDAEYQRTGMTFQEMGFEKLDERNEARICQVLKVPPILVGARIGLNRATYANYGEARRAFWEDTLTPQFRRLKDELDMDLAPEFGDDITLDWDMSEVPALQEDQKMRWDRATAALSAGGITVNDFRDEIGLPPVGNGDVFIRGLAQVEVPAKMPGVKRHEHVVEVKKQKPLDDEARKKKEAEIERALKKQFKGTLERIEKEVR